MIKTIETKKAPQAIGPYSQAVATDKLLFISGQLGINPSTGNLETGIVNQTNQVLKNLAAILEQGQSHKDSVIKCTIYVKNMGDFIIINQIYENFFGDHKPARATIEVARLPKDGLVEIDAIALISNNY